MNPDTTNVCSKYGDILLDPYLKDADDFCQVSTSQKSDDFNSQEVNDPISKQSLSNSHGTNNQVTNSQIDPFKDTISNNHISSSQIVDQVITDMKVPTYLTEDVEMNHLTQHNNSSTTMDNLTTNHTNNMNCLFTTISNTHDIDTNNNTNIHPIHNLNNPNLHNTSTNNNTKLCNHDPPHNIPNSHDIHTNHTKLHNSVVHISNSNDASQPVKPGKRHSLESSKGAERLFLYRRSRASSPISQWESQAGGPNLILPPVPNLPPLGETQSSTNGDCDEELESSDESKDITLNTSSNDLAILNLNADDWNTDADNSSIQISNPFDTSQSQKKRKKKNSNPTLNLKGPTHKKKVGIPNSSENSQSLSEAKPFQEPGLPEHCKTLQKARAPLFRAHQDAVSQSTLGKRRSYPTHLRSKAKSQSSSQSQPQSEHQSHLQSPSQSQSQSQSQPQSQGQTRSHSHSQARSQSLGRTHSQSLCMPSSHLQKQILQTQNQMQTYGLQKSQNDAEIYQSKMIGIRSSSLQLPLPAPPPLPLISSDQAVMNINEREVSLQRSLSGPILGSHFSKSKPTAGLPLFGPLPQPPSPPQSVISASPPQSVNSAMASPSSSKKNTRRRSRKSEMSNLDPSRMMLSVSNPNFSLFSLDDEG
eukprot:TRINITY_DN1381_c0_g1_i3.p1 TRINITY_DN1381_c0_g1~~TRINITY_DN1381_c0_g1_i3.p1  ORF type:complete len:711 (-),score=154.86 TRINITY_DN1381_c0_g1_i3:554-2485(-)